MAEPPDCDLPRDETQVKFSLQFHPWHETQSLAPANPPKEVRRRLMLKEFRFWFTTSPLPLVSAISEFFKNYPDYFSWRETQSMQASLANLGLYSSDFCSQGTPVLVPCVPPSAEWQELMDIMTLPPTSLSSKKPVFHRSMADCLMRGLSHHQERLQVLQHLKKEPFKWTVLQPLLERLAADPRAHEGPEEIRTGEAEDK